MNILLKRLGYIGLFTGIIASMLLCSTSVFAASIEFTPEKPMQGEPIKITVSGATLDEVDRIRFAGKSLYFFTYATKPTAFIGFDLNRKEGEYLVEVSLSNGTTLRKTLTVVKRPKIEAPLGIPDKLGGNTKAAQDKLVSNLDKENAIFNNVKTVAFRYWREPFQYPLAGPIITDDYGYSRKTGEYSIAHKGTDFRAAEGVKINAMNAGIVRLARPFTVYGNSVVIDHGLGVQTFYLHLSKIHVKEGQVVKRGQQIGLSGKTGYAESPHLHLSVKINAISIDPVTFLNFFK